MTDLTEKTDFETKQENLTAPAYCVSESASEPGQNIGLTYSHLAVCIPASPSASVNRLPIRMLSAWRVSLHGGLRSKTYCGSAQHFGRYARIRTSGSKTYCESAQHFGGATPYFIVFSGFPE